MLSKRNNILAYLLAALLAMIATILYFTADMKGFPDGHLTELDQAEQPLFYATCVLSLLATVFLLYLSRFKKTGNANRTFYRTLIFLFLMGMILGGLEWYFIETIENGGGG